MTDYVVTNGRSSAYPLRHYGGHFIGNRATFCETADFAGLSSNVLAIPNLPVTVLSASPVSVGEEFFGMHVRSRVNDTLPGITAKTIRLHDMAAGKSRWQFIQPTPSTWDWVDLDSAVNAHYAAGRDIIFTLFATPPWASARPTERNIYSDQPGDSIQYNRGIAAEPADMTKWDAFCTALAQRYLGKIKYYEVWNEPNWSNNGTGAGANTDCFFTGTFAKLAEMTRRANQAIKAVDPTAKILCPPVQGWAASSGSSDSFFTGMMSASTGDGSTTMKNWVDIIGVHLYLPTPNKVQDLAGMIDRINSCKATAGASGLPTWDTESAPIGPEMNALTDNKGKQLIGRMLLTMAAKGIARTMYYQYDGSMGFAGREAIVAYREQVAALLRSGTIKTVSRFTDGRVGYYIDIGLTII